MHEPGVEQLRILAAEIVRSRPPTEVLGSSDHGPGLEDAHAEAKRSRGAAEHGAARAELGLLPDFVRCRVDGVKGCAVSQPATLQLRQYTRARSGRDICATPARGRSRIDSVEDGATG